ncbi:MAG: hypothetical protein NTV09_05255 [Bacteroidetes bacterium]|nr:hypothetical protein [Bacteroidota bacterium]
MKNYLIVFLICFSTTLFAQQPPPGDGPPRPARERVEAMKVGFLTQRLNLTPEEAKVFWPVYNKYQDELEVLRKSRRENLVNAKMNFDEMPEKDVEKAVDSELGFRQNELDLLKKYHGQFKQVLPIKKVAKLYRAEEDFKRELLDRIKENRQEVKHDRMEKKRSMGK